MLIMSGDRSSKQIQFISGEPIFHLHSICSYVVLMYKAQAPLMYIAYSTKEMFCTKHPYQQTVGKLRFNIGKDNKLFLISSHVFLNWG